MKTRATTSIGGARVGLRDVARRCGLSVMTVSRALRGDQYVDPDTRLRVLTAARELGYVRNRLAAQFGQQKTFSVGVIIPDIDHSIFPAMVKGIEAVLNNEGYHLALSCSYDSAGKEFQEVTAMLERMVDGIILAPASVTESRQAIARLQALHCPFVMMDRIVHGVAADAVIVDDYEGAREVVRHLVAQGYRHIAHIAGPEGVWTSVERERGYRDALQAARRKVNEQLIIHAGANIPEGEAAMERLLERGEPLPDAVFCMNDPIAVGAYKALRRHGLRIPHSIGLAGFSNTLETEIMAVPLTTVVQDALGIGQRAARLLLSRMAGTAAQAEPIREVLKTQLLVRASTLRTASKS
jgi:LacI family transcriptional regulator